LEAIKARYRDITKLSTDVAKTLEQALQLARRLHSTREELRAWLDRVEVELLSYEAQVLTGDAASQAQARQKVCSHLCVSDLWVLFEGDSLGSFVTERRMPPWVGTQEKSAADRWLKTCRSPEMKTVHRNLFPVSDGWGCSLLPERQNDENRKGRKKKKRKMIVLEIHIICLG